ncbi:MAG: glycosyltransferase family 4 protein [Nanoarchaeota archaeon]|nr:glycosyltransferase family 4 protein [Nanoarchaeota archaeon]
MKIAIIYDMIYPFNVGGGESRNYFLAKELITRGHEVHFFGAKLWKGPTILNHEGIIMHGVYHSRKLYKTSRRSFDEPIMFSLKLAMHLFKEDFDIVDCTAIPYFPAFVCKLYSIIKRKPLIITWHEVWIDYWQFYLGFKGFIGRFIEKIVSRLTKKHIVVSNRTKNRLLQINPKAQVSVVPNALMFDIINGARPVHERFDLMYCGRLMPHKGVDYLLKSVRLLKEKFPKIKCLIIGNGPEQKKLYHLAKKLAIEENVLFKNFLPKSTDVYSYMKASKIFVFPSILEGFGIVVIEAMACGLPIVGVKHRWNASEDLINENKAGFVVDRNPIVIAEKVSYLLTHKRSYNKFVGNNISKSEKYQIEIIAKQIEKIYEALL